MEMSSGNARSTKVKNDYKELLELKLDSKNTGKFFLPKSDLNARPICKLAEYGHNYNVVSPYCILD